jgi:hypothetical protein
MLHWGVTYTLRWAAGRACSAACWVVWHYHPARLHAGYCADSSTARSIHAPTKMLMERLTAS